MRLPSVFRRTPFRLTLSFLALFATAASALLLYIYFASQAESAAQARADIERELSTLEAIYRARGVEALNADLIDRASRGGSYLFLLMDSEGRPQTGNVNESPIVDYEGGEQWESFRLSGADEQGRVARRWAMGVQLRLAGGELLFVGEDIGDSEQYLNRLSLFLWGAAGIVFLLGLGGGLLVSRQVEGAMARLNAVVDAARSGDLQQRVPVQKTGDELDELAVNLNAMLDRLEQSMSSIRHAGDAIAHDLRSPLTRMRARLEIALIDAEAGRVDGQEALARALGETDDLLKTFNTVLSIARLQAAAEIPDAAPFDVADLATDIAELYAPAAEDKGLDFAAEIGRGLQVSGNRAFLAQALSNIVDNAIKYTPQGGALMLRARRRASGEVEVSVTDTGPGVPLEDRERILDRFVRLDDSRTQAGAGLGLSLVTAVASAHAGRIELSDGPGAIDGFGPGLRAALVLPAL
ncbi:MAG: HAMP domain-containing protein [Caulobacterales bacterium]|nr:HAMP domain-containing protein [Caulobacterales bacterium]